MRASFEPSVIQLAVLFGWSAYGAVRDRIEQLRARWRGADADAPVVSAPQAASQKTPQNISEEFPREIPPYNVTTSPERAAAPHVARRRVDYSIN